MRSEKTSSAVAAALGAALLSASVPANAIRSARAAEGPPCRAVREGGALALESPLFRLVLEASPELRATTWERRGREGRPAVAVSLAPSGPEAREGRGSELEVDLGPLDRPPETPRFRVASVETSPPGSAGEAVCRLVSEDGSISARVTYLWSAGDPVLRKRVEISNSGPREVLLRDVRLGDYTVGASPLGPSGDRAAPAAPLDLSGGPAEPIPPPAEPEQGFPLYLGDSFFLSLAHPAGRATSSGGRVTLRQHPGRKLPPGATFACMEAVYGVGDGSPGGARKAFVAHVRSRMRRVVRGHDRPYAIFDNFGSWSLEKDPGLFGRNCEAFLLHSLDRLAASQEATGCRFDVVNIHFWVDHAGDLKRFDPERFPRGPGPILDRLKGLGIAPGLWIDSSMRAWSIGRNPAADPSIADDPAWFCRASEPIRTMYLEAFRHHIRENGVRLIKFDNLRTVCHRSDHGHLPGIYSTEAIVDSVIEFLRALDAECPDVFLILYWGHRSPWWLLHGDTLFDSGLGIEAASPSTQPSLYARDSITQKLDQAHQRVRDLPWLGKDSLGVWLSDWAWNSGVGKERWQEGFVMDIARGSLLAQLWADRDWLSPPEWREMADLIALLKARPACFAHPIPIVGDPWKDEPYGYSCSDGERAFLAIHNCAWRDSAIPLSLGSPWGLPDGRRWDIYRWYPEPARLAGRGESFGEFASIALRPFEVVLLEVVPAGAEPTLRRAFETRPIPAGFAEASLPLELTARLDDQAPPADEGDAAFVPLRPRSASSAGGAALTILADGSILAGGANPSPDVYAIVAETDLAGITAFRLEVLPDPSLPSGGPGRAYNGNFALAEFAAEVAPRGGGAASKVELRRAAADFSQASHGGWPIEASIDGNLETAWSIHPEEGAPHVAVFETREPVGFEGGTAIAFALSVGYRRGPADHTIGKLRLSATTAKPPIAVPRGYGKRPWIVRTTVPPTAGGGILAIAAEFRKGGEPVERGNIGSLFEAAALLDGRPVPLEPVLAKETYPSSWQAWRIRLAPSAAPRRAEISVKATVPPEARLRFRAFLRK